MIRVCVRDDYGINLANASIKEEPRKRFALSSIYYRYPIWVPRPQSRNHDRRPGSTLYGARSLTLGSGAHSNDCKKRSFASVAANVHLSKQSYRPVVVFHQVLPYGLILNQRKRVSDCQVWLPSMHNCLRKGSFSLLETPSIRTNVRHGLRSGAICPASSLAERCNPSMILRGSRSFLGMSDGIRALCSFIEGITINSCEGGQQNCRHAHYICICRELSSGKRGEPSRGEAVITNHRCAILSLNKLKKLSRALEPCVSLADDSRD